MSWVELEGGEGTAGPPLMVESFSFEDENEYEYEIQCKFLRVFSKQRTPRKASFYFFSLKKLVRLFILKEVQPSPMAK